MVGTETMWVKTHEALNNFMATLACGKCNQRLRNPQQFLNCGHYACAKCIGKETNCVACHIPSEVTEIYADREINDLLNSLNVIAEAVGLSFEDHNDYEASESISATSTSDKNISKKKGPKKQTSKGKDINETMNTSICESNASRSTFNIPKNINKKNNQGETPLHIACRNNHEEKVKLLLEKGANPNTKDNAGWTPLQEAASYNFYNVCETLLKAGASPNMIGFDNRTALHEAVIVNDLELVSLLINHKASRDLCDKEGKKPKDYSKSKEMVQFFKTLKDSNNKEESSNDVTKIIDKTLDPVGNGKIVLYGSNLKLSSRKQLIKLSNEKRIKVVNNFSLSVSHVIIDAEDDDNITLTFDVLLTILHGKKFLNSACLPILLDNENVYSSQLSIFEINPQQLDNGPLRARDNMEKQNPKLFNNCFFFFAMKSTDSIKYDGVSFTKENLSTLVAAGGGTIMTREPRPEDIQGLLTPFHTAHDPSHSLHKCTHYIIYIPDNDDVHSNSNRLIYNMRCLKSLPLMWFIESILRYKLLDPVDMGLITQ
ncbi:BRCA1-associated RING domain protein 1 [Copidosoma floridanum]|uniref:BRCA1-associated RING domain protein 1 n=1 Tax=Copidosoma floridanum TaxID=29053 RepID=UPI0006C9AA09|nr:BRCA1-associated RING domain protein 1 [Copidosoma floridanum]